MASIDLEYNSGFPIYKADGTPFHDLVLHKCTYETVVMSLGDKISGILYYKDNALDVTMSEYIIYKGVRYTLVNPPTILREGLVSDNNELRGMTKYSFTFYHPMYVLNDFPFSDVAVQSGQNRYLSQNKTFSWIGTLVDFVAKLNKNLEDTQWMVTIGNVTQEEQTKLSEVLSFDKNTIAEALKRGYETWEVPYVVDQIPTSSQYYPEKRFVVQYGLPTTEILDEYNQPFVFQMGQGVGLKNNSRNPKNNKIITRIAGYGSEDNIPYDYPQIPYYGGNVQYPLYYGIVGGQRVQLIKHPFTRNHLMPSVYSQSVYNKVNPKLSNGTNNPNYDPTIELVDYYDANNNTYPNRIKQNSPSYEIHEFGDIKPEFGEKTIISAVPVNQQETQSDYKQKADFLQEILDRISATEIEDEKTELLDVYDRVDSGLSYYKKHGEEGGDTYWYVFSITTDDYYEYVSYESSNYNFTATVLKNGSSAPTPDWDDTMDDDGNYLQSYFKITLPRLATYNPNTQQWENGIDLYACAAITQEMKINMRSGACIGCTFPVEVDWDDYKRNFYNSDGEFDPDGQQRDYTKYPDSSSGQITVMVKKELETFGTLMPNQYQQPTTGDKFVILGISLPNTYITSAEQRLDTDMKQYMRDNNVYYFDYPLKFDEHFLISHEDILSQMKNNVVVRFKYADEEQPKALYIKQMAVKYNESPLPKYDITLTDDIEIVLNQIGQVTDEVSKLRLGFGTGGFGTVEGAEYLRKDIDDTARGTIRMIKGMQVGERFVTGLLGEGGVFRKDSDGKTYLETDKLYVRMKAYFDTVEVKHYLHTGGNRIASQASGIVCSRVEMIDANNNLAMDVADAVLFRCFFKANDGDKTIRNDFMIGDLAFCRETNVNVSEVNMHGYWRLVVGRNYDGYLTDNKEAWIDLSNRASETLTIGGEQYVCNGYQNGSDAPIAQDDIIQLGNIANEDRQGAIVEYVGGEDAPSYQIFQGIGSDLPYPYTLEDKNYIGLGYSSQTGRAYMNVYGDMFIGAKPDPITGESPTYIKYVQEDEETGEPRLKIKAEVEFIHSDGQGGTESTTMDDFIDAIKQSLEDIQDQIDGSIDTWYYEGAPTLNNLPASQWTTDELKHEHIGDLYYDKRNGDAYRFIFDTSVTPNEYKWIQLHDDAIAEALRLAAEAKDTADNKRRVFLTQPIPPYDQGDLWVNAVWPASGEHQGETYNNEILKCVTAKTDEQAFSISDWSVANGYTAALNNFLTNTYAPFVTNIQGQVDKKAETWYQDSDPSVAWTTADLKANHVGDIWCDTSQNGGKKTYIWKDFGTNANPRYAWAEQAVPDAVFDKIDGKADIFVSRPTTYNTNDMWIIESGLSSTYMPAGCQSGDIVISGASRVNNYQKTDWTKKDRYTDDSKFNGYINAILNGTGSSGDAATVAAAQKAIKEALGNGTLIDGGLVLTSLIGMRDNQNKVWSGINGQYQSAESGTGYKGHGIAAWYGGGMADWEVYKESHPTATINDTYAKSLFRFDGSGYLAGGNITWTKNGQVTISDLYTMISGESDFQTDVLNKATLFSNLFHTSTTGTEVGTLTRILPQAAFKYIDIDHDSNYTFTNSSVLNYGEMRTRFVPLEFFNALFSAFSVANQTSSSTPINPSTWTAQTVINNLKINVGTWTEQYLSTLGINQNSGGGIELNTLLTELNAKEVGIGVLVRNGTNSWSWMPYNAGTSGDYLPLTLPIGGKTVSSPGINSSVTFKNTASDYTLIRFEGNTAGGLGFIGIGKTNNNVHLSYVTADANGGYTEEESQWYTILHTGNFIAGNNISFTWNTDNKLVIASTYSYTLPTASSTVKGGVKVGNGLTITSDTLSLAASGVTAGIYRSVTIDTYGRVTAGTNPTTLAEYNISDANIASGVITLGNNTITPLTDAKIKNDYSWWGRKLDATSGEVSGNMTSVGDITMSGGIKMNRGQFIQMYVNDGYRNVLGTDSSDNILSLGYRTAEQGFSTRIYGTDVRLCYYNATDKWKEGMRLTSVGRLGIGTTDPQYKLDVNGTAYVGGDLRVGNERFGWNAVDGRDVFFLYSWNDNEDIYRDMVFGTYIDAIQYGGMYFNGSSWRWGIGFSEPKTKLDVNGGVKASKFYLYKPNANNDTGAVYIEYVSSGNGKGVHLVGDGFYSDSFVSTLGTGNSGSGGAIDLTNVVTNIIPSTGNTYNIGTDGKRWDNVYTRNINVTNDVSSLRVSSSMGFYVPSKDNTYVLLAGGGTKLISEIGGGGTVSSITVGTTSYTPTNGVVTLPNYLPLAGGTLTGQLTVKANLYQPLCVNSTHASTNKTCIQFGHTQNNEYTDYGGILMDSANGYLKRYTAGVLNSYTILDSGNSSVSKSGETLTVTINGTAQSLTNTNTWRGIQDNLTSTSTVESLSANQGKILYGYITTLQGYFDNGVANSAAKLTTTSKKLWGNTYWTSGGVPTDIGTSSSNASLNYVLDITMSGNLNMARNKYLCVDDGNNGTYYGVLGEWIGTTNALFLGYYLARDKSRPTYIYGNDVAIFSKVDGTLTKGFSLNTKGNVCIGNASPSSTVGDILALSPASSSSYTAILYNRPSGYASWSVAANNSNNFYWYTWGGGVSGTAMSLTNTGSLTLGSGSGTYIKIGELYLVYDSTNNALKVSASATGNNAANFYATGAVSALGAGSGGSGGGGIDMDTVWTALQNNASGHSIGTSTNRLYALYATSIYANGVQVLTTSNGVTLNGNQTINDNKTFSGNILASNSNTSLGSSSTPWGTVYCKNATIDKGAISILGTMSTMYIKEGHIYDPNNTIAIQAGSDTANNGTANPKNVTICNGGGNVGIGTAADNTHKMKVSGSSLFDGNVGIGGYNSSYKLYVSGRSYFTDRVYIGSSSVNENVFLTQKSLTPAQGASTLYFLDINAAGLYLNGSPYNSSDIRKKNVEKNLDFGVEDVARAPIFDFTWKTGSDKLVHVGSSAQYWKPILPNAVLDFYDDGLALDYGATALAAAVMTARTVLTHEARIRLLEVENQALRKEIEQLKKAA